MKTVTFTGSWVYLGKIYTPDDTEVEDDVFEALEKRGAFSGQGQPKATLQTAQEAENILDAEDEEQNQDEDDEFLTTLKPLHADVIGALNNAGFTTLQQLKDATDEEIIKKAVGVGAATVSKMRLLLSAA